MTLRVRPATLADAPRLSELGAATFRDTFAGENTPEDMARHVAEAFTPERQAAEIGDPSDAVLLAECPAAGRAEGVELVGYAHLVSGPAPAAVRGPAPLELERLYVARAWHGRGVASALMDAAIDAARARGAETLWLGVPMRTGITRLLLHSVLIAAPAVLGAQGPPPAAPVAARGGRPHVDPRAWAHLAPAPNGERRRPWLRNALVGAAVGGVVGYGLGRSSCDRCDEPAPIYAAAALGAGAGVVLGLAVTLTARGAQVRWGAGVAAPVP